MKKFLALLLLAGISCQLAAQNMQPLALSSPIPMADAKMKATDGKQYSIADVKGKNGVLVMFSCNTCPYVVRYQARTRETLKYAKENGFGIIIINSNEAQRDDEDSYAAMKSYSSDQGYVNIPYVVDEKSAVANAFGATRTPELFLFNKKGVLVYHGAIDDNHIAAEAKRQHAKMAMEELAMGKEIAVKESRSVGCTIKRL
jgi:thioredoxin-related protein